MAFIPTHINQDGPMVRPYFWADGFICYGEGPLCERVVDGDSQEGVHHPGWLHRAGSFAEAEVSVLG